MNIYNDICHINKPGGAPIKYQTILQLTEATLLQARPLTEQIRSFLERKENFQESASPVPIYNFELPI